MIIIEFDTKPNDNTPEPIRVVQHADNSITVSTVIGIRPNGSEEIAQITLYPRQWKCVFSAIQWIKGEDGA